MSSDDVTITDGDAGFLRGEGDGVYNIYSPAEVAALRAHFAAEIDDPNHAYVIGYRKALDDVAERMPEDVQALVERVEALARAHRVQARDGFRPDHAEQADLFEQIHTALEAAYSQKVEPEPEWEYGVRDYRSFGDGVRVVGPTWDASLREFYGERPLMRRRPAGEWEPVEEGTDDGPR